MITPERKFLRKPQVKERYDITDHKLKTELLENGGVFRVDGSTFYSKKEIEKILDLTITDDNELVKYKEYIREKDAPGFYGMSLSKIKEIAVAADAVRALGKHVILFNINDINDFIEEHRVI